MGFWSCLFFKSRTWYSTLFGYFFRLFSPLLFLNFPPFILKDQKIIYPPQFMIYFFYFFIPQYIIICSFRKKVLSRFAHLIFCFPILFFYLYAMYHYSLTFKFSIWINFKSARLKMEILKLCKKFIFGKFKISKKRI